MSHPIIAVDWDGTLVTNEWPTKSQRWMPGALDAMDEFLLQGFRVFVFTARIAPGEFRGVVRDAAGCQEEINYIREMLDGAGLHAVDIWTGEGKPYADVYVDDRAVHYAGRKQSWENLTDKLLTMFDVEEV